MPFPLLLVEEDTFGNALLDDYAIGVVGGIGPVDLYHESLRAVADKFVALLLGALAPKLIVGDGSSVAELDSTHCHALFPSRLPLFPLRQKKEGAVPCRSSGEAVGGPVRTTKRRCAHTGAFSTPSALTVETSYIHLSQNDAQNAKS